MQELAGRSRQDHYFELAERREEMPFVPDDVIDYVEYDDGLPNTEEDSYINDDESFTEDS